MCFNQTSRYKLICIRIEYWLSGGGVVCVCACARVCACVFFKLNGSHSKQLVINIPLKVKTKYKNERQLPLQLFSLVFSVPSYFLFYQLFQSLLVMGNSFSVSMTALLPHLVYFQFSPF